MNFGKNMIRTFDMIMVVAQQTKYAQTYESIMSSFVLPTPEEFLKAEQAQANIEKLDRELIRVFSNPDYHAGTC